MKEENEVTEFEALIKRYKRYAPQRHREYALIVSLILSLSLCYTPCRRCIVKERLATGDKVVVIDRGSPHLDKHGIVEDIGFIPVILLLQGINRKETYVKVRLDNNIVVTFTDIEKSLKKQISKLA